MQWQNRLLQQLLQSDVVPDFVLALHCIHIQWYYSPDMVIDLYRDVLRLLEASSPLTFEPKSVTISARYIVSVVSPRATCFVRDVRNTSLLVSVVIVLCYHQVVVVNSFRVSNCDRFLHHLEVPTPCDGPYVRGFWLCKVRGRLVTVECDRVWNSATAVGRIWGSVSCTQRICWMGTRRLRTNINLRISQA